MVRMECLTAQRRAELDREATDRIIRCESPFDGEGGGGGGCMCPDIEPVEVFLDAAVAISERLSLASLSRAVAARVAGCSARLPILLA